MNSLRFIKENEISQLIKKDNNCSAHFQWNTSFRFLTLDVITFNPSHKNYFLLHSISKEDSDITDDIYLTILDEMIEYIKETQKINVNYCINWNYKISSDATKNSYFSGTNMKDILNKFFYGKTYDSIIIYSINMVSES